MTTKNPAAVALGKLTSPRKAAAARENGKRGGAPKKPRCRYGDHPIDARTLAAGGEVCFDCATKHQGDSDDSASRKAPSATDRSG